MHNTKWKHAIFQVLSEDLSWPAHWESLETIAWWLQDFVISHWTVKERIEMNVCNILDQKSIHIRMIVGRKSRIHERLCLISIHPVSGSKRGYISTSLQQNSVSILAVRSLTLLCRMLIKPAVLQLHAVLKDEFKPHE